MNAFAKRAEVRIFPNPVQQSFQLSLPEGLEVKTIRLLDLVGNTQRAWPGGQAAWDVADVSAGFYLLRIDSNEGTYLQKLIKE